MMPMPDAPSLRHGVVVLAAGLSKRLGRPKALIEIAGETLVHRATRLALATAPGDCVVVSGADDACIARAVADLGCRVVPCIGSPRGMSASLQCGLRSLALDCSAALIVLVDQPAVSASHLCALRDAWHRQPGRAAASAYADTIGVPAILPRAWFDETIDANNDKGARELLRSRRGDVHVIPAPLLVQDIDTRADLAVLESNDPSKRD